MIASYAQPLAKNRSLKQLGSRISLGWLRCAIHSSSAVSLTITAGHESEFRAAQHEAHSERQGTDIDS